jgi:radical SAM superfamily enzyme YgiQ (UPF0313 family)
VRVIMGGYHPSHIPYEVRSHADSVYIGDSEDLWPKVISDAKRGKLDRFYRAKCIAPQTRLFPRRDIYKGKHYLPVTVIQFSRGCQFGCNFCSISSFRKKNYFCRPVKDVIAEIENQTRKWFLFADDNIVMEPKAAKELFRALIPLKIHWFSEGSINMARDLELMDLMLKSGCIGHLIGFESINRESLISMRKTPNLSGFDQYHAQLKVIHNYGLPIWATFTLGHEFDTLETIERTLEFSMKHKFALADYNVLTPYPNTPLYHRLAREKRLLYGGKWWLHPDFRFGHAAFRPRNMSADELTQGCFDAYKKFYGLDSIIRRAINIKTNLRSLYHAYLYLLCNGISHHDTIKKQGIMLGEKDRHYISKKSLRYVS